MKKIRTSLFRPVLIAFGLFFVLTSFIVALSSYGNTSRNVQIDPKGWIWNGYQLEGSDDAIGLGWTSINCLNDFDNDGYLEYRCAVDPAERYGVWVNDGGDGLSGSDNYLEGCAWSSSYGWVCFDSGDQCNATATECSVSGTACDDVGDCPALENCVLSDEAQACADLNASGVQILPYPATGDPLFHYLKSPTWDSVLQKWSALDAPSRASILSLWESARPDKSYIGFPFGDPDGDLGNGIARASSTDAVEDNTLIGCFNCDAETNRCGACLNVSTQEENQLTNPNPNLLCWDCETCGEISQDGGSCALNKSQYSCAASSCSGCTDYPGVIINDIKPEVIQADQKKYEMCGWGYHAYIDSGYPEGLGWVAFNAESRVGDIAYVDVREGSIASGSDIISLGAPPVGATNAAYIIEAGGTITNWRSTSGSDFGSRDVPDFPTAQGSSGVYTNVLGKLDVTGLITDVVYGVVPGPDNEGTNKYGRSVYTYGPGAFGSAGYLCSAAFNDGVIVFEADPFNPVTISANECASDIVAGLNDVSGAGIIFVNDDLYIGSNIMYEVNPTITKLAQIPSLVWIVKGDVTIDSAVTNVAGTFIVLGNDSPCPDTLTSPSAGCGRFSTGDSAEQLVIHGSVIARQFNFQRSYGGTTETDSSEKFIPDGRLQANPPSGMTNFAGSVPRFSSSN